MFNRKDFATDTPAQAQADIQAGRTKGAQACADYIKAHGWTAARDHLNTQQPPGAAIFQSNSTYGYWAGWADHLVSSAK